MPYRDLRQFLDVLRKEGELLEIDRPMHLDTDIDITSSSDMEWAMSFRVRPDRDLFVIENVPATHLDPSVDQSGALETHISSAVGIDATRPVGAAFADVADVPGWRDYKLPELDKWRVVE